MGGQVGLLLQRAIRQPFDGMVGVRYAAAMNRRGLALWGVRALLALMGSVALTPAQAESLRCNGHLVSEGDTRLSVLHRCGQPVLSDTRCSPVYVAGRRTPLPDPLAALVAPCVPLEDWLYERGPGYLTATVRFRSGVVQAILYGQEGQRAP